MASSSLLFLQETEVTFGNLVGESYVHII